MTIFTRVKKYYLRKKKITLQETTGLDSITREPQSFKKVIANYM